MGEIKWIKITTDIFDNQKIRQIEVLPDGDSIIVIWLKLLTLAGKINDNGQIYLTNEIPYTEEMLATAFNRNINTIRVALNTFEQFGMINRIDNILEISNWDKYQNIEGMEKVREQTRQRVANYRARQKQIEQKECNVTSRYSNGTDIEIEEDIEEEKEIEKDIKKISQKPSSSKGFLKHSKQDDFKADGIIDIYNSTCTKLSKLRVLSDKRKEAAEKIYKKYGLDAMREVFEIANNTPFLTGANDRGWKADFDFMMREDKFIAILEGKYNSKKSTKKFGEESDEKCGNGRKEYLNARKSF